ncbi:MAG: DUF427 domain-containing protein [Actinomyces sp.]|nr:MAG: DUF427 domain-containing protein [Actinomyces sp.]
MARAIFNDTVIAESDDIELLEGNAYFPLAALRRDVLHESAHTTRCPWKGTARYFTIEVDGEVAPNAAWYYPDPSPAAAAIRDRVAFYPVVRVEP